VHKTQKLYFVLACLWTLFIITASLISLEKAPKIHIAHLDKVVHTMFYFLFVVLWLLALKPKKRFIVFGIALLLGGIIELLQGEMHFHRSADIFDFLANSIGATLGILAINKIILLLKRFHLYN